MFLKRSHTDPTISKRSIVDADAAQRKTAARAILLLIASFMIYQIDMRWAKAIAGSYGYWFIIAILAFLLLLCLITIYQTFFKIDYQTVVPTSDVLSIVNFGSTKSNAAVEVQLKLINGKRKVLKFSNSEKADLFVAALTQRQK
jgi:hypothetical protein